MRIAVMGAGGVGGYFGGLLARAGQDVTFVARGAHLAAIRRAGLRVESVHGDFVVLPAQGTDDLAELGPVDLILFTTKTYQIEAAARAALPLVGPETAVLPLQNGVNAAERLARVLPPMSVLGGACWVVSAVISPGVVRQESTFRRIVVGELDGAITARVRRIVGLLEGAGADAEATSAIQKVLWSKFLFIASFSGIGAVTRLPAGDMWSAPEARALIEESMREVEALARAQGVPLEPDIVPRTMAFCEALAPETTASMQRDIIAGRPSELEAHSGHLARMGAELGIPTPIHRFIYGALLPQERRARVGVG